MTSFLLIPVCIIAGMLIRRYGKLPADSYKAVNTWLIYLALPAVSLRYLPHIEWSKDLLVPVIAPIILWLGAWLYIRLYASRTKMPKPREGGLKLTSGLSNTSFIGFPLITAYFGEQYLGLGLICDQVTFMLLSTAGIVVSMYSSAHHTLSAKTIIKRLFLFPPFLAFVTALTIPHFISMHPLEPLFEKLASTVGPLALFSIGFQLKFSGWREHIKPVTVSLLYKLLLGPAIILGICLLFNFTGIAAQISVFEMAMPTLLSAGIVAEQYELEPALINLVIGVGIVISFVTIAAWWWIINTVM